MAAPSSSDRGSDCAHAPCRGSINSPFGPRRGIQDRSTIRQHQGADLAGRVGDPVFAAGVGVVEHATANGARGFGCYGRVIVIAHPQWGEDRTLYAHLSAVHVEPGDRVEAGQQIGEIGATNGSEAHPGTTFAEGSCQPGGGFTRRSGGSGPHLHFEARAGRYPAPYDAPRYDPIEWLAERGIVYRDRRLVVSSSCPDDPSRLEPSRMNRSPQPPAEPRPISPALAHRTAPAGGIVFAGTLAGMLIAIAARSRR